jgi:DNA-binding transcriptional LysR family regulator
MGVELRHMRYFVAVAEELHFGRAAKRLFMSQPPLSLQIKGLEDALGVELLHRTKRRVALTSAGQVFLEEARQVLALADRAKHAAIRAQRGEIGHLAVGFVGSATYQALPTVLRRVRSAYPEVEFRLREMTTAEQTEALQDRTLDVGFVRPPLYDPRLVTKTLLQEEFVLVLPEAHPLCQVGHVELKDVADERFILYPRQLGPGLYDPVVSACQEAGFSPNVVQEANQMHTILSLVLAGFGIAFVPEGAKALRWEGVVYKRLASNVPRTTIALAWNLENRSTTLSSFVGQVDRLGEIDAPIH